MREFPGKGRKTFGLDNVITKLFKKGRPSASVECDIADYALEPNDRRKRLLGLKLVCW